ncbi:YigZ family protein [Corynebacterium mayonis]|uniref:YigZ family protein n=1 Tax=Corynebacterium mayonis TaxID=3062461 RepID=UPI00313FEE00
MPAPRTPETYQCPAAGEVVHHELEIKRSRFITRLGRVQSETDARALIASARQEFPDARHHCSAYIYHVDNAQPVERSSDDGEPAGTAGRPMLEVLKGSGLVDVCAVVIRYFGGVKLGTGGLVSAYGEAVSAALGKVHRVRRSIKALGVVDLPHAHAGRIEAELRAAGIEVVDVDYASMARYTLAFNPEERNHVEATLAAATHGSATLRQPNGPGYTWVENPTR